MPKNIIREKDYSRANVYGANSFSVVVPGYTGDDFNEFEAEKIKIGPNVYELNSISDFDTYIKKYSGKEETDKNTEPVVVNESGVGIAKYQGTVTKEDFENNEYKVYRAEAMAQTDSRFNTYGPNVLRVDATHQYALVEVTYSDNLFTEFEVTTENQEDYPDLAPGTYRSEESTDSDYLKVYNSELGRAASSPYHIGNQIAYELLKLGYIVLFKKMDKTKDALEELSNTLFWEQLKDRSIYDFRYILSGLRGDQADSAVMNNMINVASFSTYDQKEDHEMQDVINNLDIIGATNGRGDCIALCDIDERCLENCTTDKEIVIGISESVGRLTNDKYAAIFGPQVTYNMSEKEVEDFGGNKTFPASFHYLACAANTFSRFSEWYAVAGYSRGQSARAVESTSFALGERVINTLAPRAAISNTEYSVNKAVNLILKERGNYYLWGNRTAHVLDSDLVFSHFLNIRQLCTTIKKQLYTACRKFTFDPNSDLLWINFVNAIKPTLESMRADYGIKGYKIIKKADNSKAMLKAIIRIVPIEAVEDFDITISLEESLSGITANVSE